jgi:hypothetical protein
VVSPVSISWGDMMLIVISQKKSFFFLQGVISIEPGPTETPPYDTSDDENDPYADHNNHGYEIVDIGIRDIYGNAGY